MGAFDDAWEKFEQEAGPLLTQELSAQAPVGDPEYDPEFGTLQGSMEWVDETAVGQPEMSAGSRDPRGPIAAYVTRGTRPHSIDPVNANALHFISPFYGEVFTQHVDHPGTAPNPFHITAWENRRNEVMELFAKRMGHEMTLSYLNPWRNRDLSSDREE
jgi:hypothetical protein